MRHRAWLGPALLLAAAPLLPALRHDATPGAEPAAARLDALFADLHARGLFDGAAVAGRSGAEPWAGAYGWADAERRVPFTPDTPADGGSLAKTMTATLVLALADEGRLDLDAPARRLLPELPYPEITLRHLLSHSGGIPVADYDWFDPWLPPGRVRTTESLLGVLEAQRPALAFPPGSAFEYSSLGFDLAALAAARAAGRPLDALFAERLFAPLGLGSAFLRPARLGDFPAPRTRGHRRADGRLEPHEVFDFEGFHGGSNVYLSARDLHRWSAAFLERRPLGERAFRRAHEPARIGGRPSGLTLGSWYRDAEGLAFSYAGHLQGFHAEAYRDTRTGLAVAYVSNNTLAPWLQHAIVLAAAAAAEGRPVPPLAPPATGPVDAAGQPRLAGSWRLEDGETIGIAHEADRLVLTRDGVAYRMVQVDPASFYVPGVDFMVGFAAGSATAPERIHVATNFAARWGVRASGE